MLTDRALLHWWRIGWALNQIWKIQWDWPAGRYLTFDERRWMREKVMMMIGVNLMKVLPMLKIMRVMMHQWSEWKTTRMMNNDSNQCNQMKEGWCQLKNCWNVEKQFFVNFIRLNPLKDSARLKDFSFFWSWFTPTKNTFNQIGIKSASLPQETQMQYFGWSVDEE